MAVLLCGHALAQGQAVRYGGFLSLGYLDSSHYNYLADTEDGTTEFSEVGLNVSWTPMDRLTVSGQLFAFDLGHLGNFDPLIDYLFVDYNFNPSFGLRAGRVKRENGLFNDIQDIDVARTGVLLPTTIYDPRYRDLTAALDGVAAYGSVDLFGNVSMDYNIYGGYVELSEAGGITGEAVTGFNDIFRDVSVDRAKGDLNYGYQLIFYPGIDGLKIGTSLSLFDDIYGRFSGTVPDQFPVPFFRGQEVDIEIGHLDVLARKVFFEYYHEEWIFGGEFLLLRSRSSTTNSILGTVVDARDLEIRGDSWYLQASRNIGDFQVGLTYSVGHRNRDNRDGEGLAIPHSNFTKDWQLSGRWNVSDHWTLKLELHNIEGTGLIFNNFGQNPIRTEKDWNLFAAKSTFSF